MNRIHTLSLLITFCLSASAAMGFQSTMDSIQLEKNISLLDSDDSNEDWYDALESLILHYSVVQPDSMMNWVKFGQERKIADPVFATWLVNMEGQALFQKGQYSEAKSLFKSAEKTAIRNSDLKNQARANEGLSKAYLYSGAKDSVSIFGLKALHLFEELGDTSSQIQTLMSLYQVQSQIGNVEGAKNHLDVAESLAINSKTDEWLGTIYMNHGIYHYMKGSKVEHSDSAFYWKSMDAALEYYTKAEKVYESEGNVQRKAIALANAGLVYKEKLNWKKAYDNFKIARDLAQEFNNEFYIVGFEMSMADCMANMERPDEALKLLFHSVEYYKKTQNAEKLADCYNFISQAYATKGDYVNALKYKNGQLNTKLESYDSLTIQKINELETRYETEKKEAEISRLALEDQLNQSKILQQRVALGGSVIGIGLLSFLLYRLFNQNKKIESQNQIISKALSEKETLLKEIHHRVKNNLQVISSLLRIQSHQTTDEVAVDALKEGQSRVHAMSLIHEDLYEHDDLKAINAKKYLEKLADNIFQTYKISEGVIQLEKNIESVELDIDTVVPLGLILNELITNSLKYAFPNGRKGKILLSLKQKGDRLLVRVEDDGIGTSENLEKAGFGTGLVKSLLHKIEGTLEVKTQNGLSTVLNIPREIIT